MSYFVTVGILLGLSAGVAPGPLLTLVVSETLSGGVGAGVRVALSPLLSDLPIILFAVFFVFGSSDTAGGDVYPRWVFCFLYGL